MNIFQEIKNEKLEIILLIIIFSLLLLWKVGIDIVIFSTVTSMFLLYGWKSGIIAKAVKKAIKRVGQDIVNKKLCTILLAIVLILLLIWKFTTETAVLWMIFLTFLFYGWENRILARLVLFFLISCPILLVFGKEPITEQMAIYAYYFLVMTVVLQIKEYWQESKKPKRVDAENKL